MVLLHAHVCPYMQQTNNEASGSTGLISILKAGDSYYISLTSHWPLLGWRINVSKWVTQSEKKTFKLEPATGIKTLSDWRWMIEEEWRRYVLCPPVITHMSELWPLHSWTRLLHVQYKLYPTHPLLTPTTLLPPNTPITYCWGKLCSCMFRYKQGNRYQWSRTQRLMFELRPVPPRTTGTCCAS